MRCLPLFACLMATMPAGAAALDAPQFVRFQLESGINVIVVHIPDAPRQSTFTFLPLHMANDGAGRAQWSHLLEHHLIRTTDAEGLEAEGLSISGETTAEAMRLDTMAMPDQWDRALDRHAKWMTARDFRADIHARELTNIAAEEAGTARSGMTHKFALAAWNQVVRHGAAHAAVHGDVANSDISAVIAYGRGHLPVDERIWLATIGPIDPVTAQQEIEKRFGALERMERAMPGATRQDDGEHAPKGTVTATWDLPTRHVLIWRRLPAEGSPSAAGAIVVANSLTSQLMNARAAGPMRFPIAFDCVPTTEGRYFIVNAVLSEDADAEAAVSEVERAIAALAESPGTLGGMAQALVMQFGSPEGPSDVRDLVPEHMRHMIDGNWLIQRVMIEYRTGATLDRLVEAMAELTPESLAAHARAIATAPGGAVILNPGAPARNPGASARPVAAPQPAAPAGPAEWWSGETGGYIGAIAGSTLGLAGGFIGVAAGTGRCRRAVFFTLNTMLALGAGCLVLGLSALVMRQPYGVWYPLMLLALLCIPLSLGIRRPIRIRYEQDELRRMSALDA